MIYMSIADLQLIWFSSAAAFYPKRIKLVICQPVQSFRVNEINESFLYLESGSSAADCATSWNPVHQFFYLFYFLILSFNGCWIIYILSTGPGEIVDYFLNILYTINNWRLRQFKYEHFLCISNKQKISSK